MLPPVSSVLSTSTSYQRPMSQAVPATEIAVLAPPATSADAGLESSNDARFGILKLSGSATIANTLVALAETIGKAINLPRGEGEAGTDYLLRLADALKTLSPADQVKVSQQLNQIVQGVKLRLLADALTNPAGPEAAKLIAVLEMASSKDRDLAARAVVSSYRQNAGAEAPLAQRAIAVPPGAQLNAPVPAPSPVPTTGAQSGPPTNAAAYQPAAAEAAAVTGPGEQATAVPAARTTIGANGVVSTVPGKQLQTADAMVFAGLNDLVEASAKQTSTANLESVKSDTATGARAVQGQLQQKLEGQAIVTSANVRPEQISAAPPSVYAEAPQVRTATENVVVVSQPPLPGQSDDSEVPMSRQAMIALTDWQASEADPLLPRPVPPSLIAEPSLTRFGLQPEHRAEAVPVQTSAYRPLPFPEAEDFVLKGQHGKQSDAQLLSESQQKLPQDIPAKSEAMTAAQTPAMMEQQMAQLRSTVIRDGLPLPYIPYPIVDEFNDPSGSATDLHRGHGEEEDGAEQEPPAEDGGEGEDLSDEMVEVFDQADEQPAAEEADLAYDLYRRMAGWS